MTTALNSRIKTAPSALLRGVPHLETYTGTRSGDNIQIVCWCAIGTSHSYRDWLDAGRPATSGRPGL